MFYGVERNPVESEILPTTWFEPGVTLSGPLGPVLAYDVAVQSGLRTPGDGEPNAYRVRNGLQQNSSADLSSGGYTARLRARPLQMAELAVALHYQDDIRQGLDAERVPAELVVVNGRNTVGRFSARVLWARWDIDSPLARARRRDVQSGWYIENAWMVNPQTGVFVRYSEWDHGGTTPRTDRSHRAIGANYWPNRNLVFKVEGKVQLGATEKKGLQFGVGYVWP
jgi:hypothetical protein